MSHTTTTFLVLDAVVVVFVADRFPVAIVAVATSPALWATGVLDLRQALAGFGDHWKLGLPLLALDGAVAVLLASLFWRF